MAAVMRSARSSCSRAHRTPGSSVDDRPTLEKYVTNRRLVMAGVESAIWRARIAQPMIEQRQLRAALAPLGNRAGAGEMRDTIAQVQRAGRDWLPIQIRDKQAQARRVEVDATVLQHEVTESRLMPSGGGRP